MRNAPRLIVFLILFVILLFGAWNFIKTSKESYPELRYISNKKFSSEDLKTYFIDLAKNKGAEYAFTVLKLASLPSNTDTHLLAHGIGDVLYEQKGADGILICNEDFRNACSHSIVIGLFNSKGKEALLDIDSVCKKAPGGKGAYGMCYHGLGHGILAFEGYDKQKALLTCASLKEPGQCIGGLVMELISGGFHDRQLWQEQRQKYLIKDRPTSFCEDANMPEEGKKFCFSYLTPFLVESVGATLGRASDETLKRAFVICEKADPKYRFDCYGGFGKEFTVLAKERDVRDMTMSEEQLIKIHNWCRLAPEEGVKACISQALSSLYWGGESSSVNSINFCNLVSDLKDYCFSDLIDQVGFYVSDLSKKRAFCQEIPVSYREDCQKSLL